MNQILSIIFITYQVAVLAAFFLTIDGVIRDCRWDDLWWAFKDDPLVVLLTGIFLLAVSIITAFLLPIGWVWRDLKRAYNFIRHAKDRL